ncbi:MAG: isomerase [Micavibrio sp.]|nr:isomerase [Micavibrio sp.]|tara:strand:- start:6010 stop:6801 length:792 start_codon:yes stop_codon:yes gene_type:complete
MSVLPIYQIDAFTSEVFKGNPAAVVPLEAWLEDNVLQKIAMENNLSETAYFVKNNDVFEIRWFTPKNEVDLCGHATLASAYVIFEEMGYDKQEIVFSSRSGKLIVKNEGKGFELDFPVWSYQETPLQDNISKALGASPKALFKAYDWVALYDDDQIVSNLQPDFSTLGKITEMRGILATALSKNDKYDFISRAFFPAIGVDEDPVTGSAHCILTPFWAQRLNKTELSAYQASARGGELKCRIVDDRVFISGQACLYLKGQIYI